MGRIRWYKRDVLAALGGMSVLTLEERGAYNTLIDLIHIDDGRIEDERGFLSRWLNCDIRVWNRIRLQLLAKGKIVVADGFIYCPVTSDWMPSTDREPVPPSLRQAVIRRDGLICGYCGSTNGPFEIDHVHPVALGGPTREDNLRIACKPCNRAKGSMTAEQWIGETA